MSAPAFAPPDQHEARPAHGLTAQAGIQLLLVSRTPQWEEAVQAVAAEIGGSRVVSCDARGALVQIASARRFSHLLLEDGCADGLFDALADLTSSHALTNTSLLLLGGSDSTSSTAVIHSANHGTIREALATEQPRSDLPRTVPDSAIPATELRDAISGTMIEARYQPIVRLADREPVAFEALARLNHPARGTLLPDRFVPQLEGAGLARALTESVCARVFADVARPLIPARPLAVAVNFPLDVLLDPAALSMLEERRAAAGISTGLVVIELTESRPVQDIRALARSLDWLRALGYGVSIDDVGPAVPQLLPLLDLPFTCMKLDKDIVRRSMDDADALAFLVTKSNTAKARGMTVVAEGVETQALWDRMLSIGVDEAQGFLVARPLPASAVPIWLEAWQADESRPARD